MLNKNRKKKKPFIIVFLEIKKFLFVYIIEK